MEDHLRIVDLPLGMPLERPDGLIETIFFPISGVASVVASSEDRSVEVGLFGREGMSASCFVQGSESSTTQTTVRVAGYGLAMQSKHLRNILQTRPSIQSHFLKFACALSSQTAQTALANSHGVIERRLARWILMCHDRVDGDQLSLTHGFLAFILGVRRAGITEATHSLEGRGMILAQRGKITVLDRALLETEAGWAYGPSEVEYGRLIAS